MAQIYTAESEMERNLIKQLVSGVSQWTERSDLHTEEDLWNNFKNKLQQNNVQALDGVLLTDSEFQQIKNQLNFSSFYDAAVWLRGENGRVQVEVQREDAKLGRVFLTVVNHKEIAGGNSSYEVINQYQSNKRDAMDRNRRFDVTLLINGLPLIHIELKNRTQPYMDAFRQIQKYLKEGKFRGIYSCLQMFVVSNGTDTRYIAAAQAEEINEQFLTKWVDESNAPVTNYLKFAEDVLSIPMAHKMVAQYTVVDNSRKALIVLRPYQIHAIEAVKVASSQRKSGYVWHTTGSGKTLTSYKVARNLLQINSVDKTIFIVDRVDLDQQTTASFRAYAANDTIDIDGTDNVGALKATLLSEERTVIVTTIQKLNHLMKGYTDKEKNKKKNLSAKQENEFKKLRDLKLVFVVDECHRAVTPQKQQEINKFFVNSLWYGFTGTPIFVENARAEVGELARTTEQQYGERLHQYTVKEAIHDKAVLGFQVEYQSTITESLLNEILTRHKMGTTEGPIDKSILKSVQAMSMEAKEAELPKDYYLNEAHMHCVVDAIVNHSKKKLGLTRGSGRSYAAILTTSSIEQAQKYYKMFQNIRKGHSSIKVDESILRVLPDFPKVAITYSVSENEEDSVKNQNEMKACLLDYNEEFGTNFTMETLSTYNRNVNERLARKQSMYRSRSKQLDIVIVVDRLLTGFDAPCLSTLFIDRMPMKPHNLIQAFSRTNRLFTSDKKYGQIVTFQTPVLFEKAVKDALFLYSNGGENDVLAPTWEEANEEFLKSLYGLLAIAPTPASFDIDGASIESLRRFAKAYQQADRAFHAVQVYSEFSDDMLGTTYPMTYEKWEDYRGTYENVLDRLRGESEGGDDPILVDIEYELETTHVENINYEYIIALIQSYVPTTSKADAEERLFNSIGKKENEEVNQYIDTLAKTNPKLSDIIRGIWNAICNDPDAFENVNIAELLEAKKQEVKTYKVKDFASAWGLNEDIVAYMANEFNPRDDKQLGETELYSTSDYSAYKEKAEDPVPKLKYRKEIKKHLINFMNEEIVPLRDR